MVSRKCQYALRAVFELARQYGKGPVRIADIARAQAIPPRFLEVILSQLKRAGFVGSLRGRDGGYFLARSPDQVTVGSVMAFVQGPHDPVGCANRPAKDKCPLYGDCVFMSMWERARRAMSEVYDGTTFQSLVDEATHKDENYVPGYTI